RVVQRAQVVDLPIRDVDMPIAIGRYNWLFAGSLRAGQRAAAVTSLVHSARMNGHDPYAYLKDVLERLPTHPASRVEELLPHRWQLSAGCR
ncbi:MAG: transposase domain-containing protein, partial [Betaproteobacteria bacterium]